MMFDLDIKAKRKLLAIVAKTIITTLIVLWIIAFGWWLTRG